MGSLMKTLVSAMESMPMLRGLVGNELGRQFLLFTLAGLSSTAISYLIFLGLIELARVNYVQASVAAFFAGLLVNFRLNSSYTFGRPTGPVSPEFLRFLVVDGLSLFANVVTIYLVVEVLDLPPEVGQLIATAASGGTGFLGMRIWVFAARRG